MSELLKRSIRKLSILVNLSHGLAHPFDEARAKELFKALRDEGVSLDYGEVKMLAIENKWPKRHAEELANLAQKIGAGGRVVIKAPRDWGVPTVDKLKKEIEEENK